MQERNATGHHYSDKQISILLVTESLFAEKGYAATSIRDIAQEAGVNIAMISYYFGSKEKLLEALFLYRIDASRVMLQALVDNQSLNPVQKLELLVHNYVDKLMSHPHFFQIMSREPAIKEIRGIREIVRTTKQRNQQMIAKLIEEGQQKKVFTTEVDIALMMQTMMGTLMSVTSSIDFLRHNYEAKKMSQKDFMEMLREKLKRHLFHLLQSALCYPQAMLTKKPAPKTKSKIVSVKNNHGNKS